MSETINKPSTNRFDSAAIYDGGTLNAITAEDLKGNLVAIKQLINDRNEKANKINSLESEIQETKGELEFQKTYPYIASIAAFFNVAGTILVAFSVNQLTSPPADENTTSSVFLIILGGLIVLVASVSTILYRWVRTWFNNKKQNIK